MLLDGKICTYGGTDDVPPQEQEKYSFMPLFLTTAFISDYS